MSLMLFQWLSAIACTGAAVFNFVEGRRWRKRRDRMRLVGKVMSSDQEACRLGFVGTLPEVGTLLYRLDEVPPPAPKKDPRQAFSA